MLSWPDGGRNTQQPPTCQHLVEGLGDYFRSIFDLQLSQAQPDSHKCGRHYPALFGRKTDPFQHFLHVVKRHSSVMGLSVCLSSLQRGNLVTSWLDNLTQRAGERMKGGGEGSAERRDGNAAY